MVEAMNISNWNFSYKNKKALSKERGFFIGKRESDNSS